MKYQWETHALGRNCPHPSSTHYQFPYFFTDNDESAPDGGDLHGIGFNTYIQTYDGDLLIFYDSLSQTASNYIDCWCSRWDVSNYSFTIETWLKKDDIDTLRTNITPGAVGELYRILGRPLYYDKTWSRDNTLMFFPNIYKSFDRATQNYISGSATNLSKMRSKTIGYVKNVTEHPIPNTDWIEVKIECMISGSGGL